MYLLQLICQWNTLYKSNVFVINKQNSWMINIVKVFLFLPWSVNINNITVKELISGRSYINLTMQPYTFVSTPGPALYRVWLFRHETCRRLLLPERKLSVARTSMCTRHSFNCIFFKSVNFVIHALKFLLAFEAPFELYFITEK